MCVHIITANIHFVYTIITYTKLGYHNLNNDEGKMKNNGQNEVTHQIYLYLTYLHPHDT